MYHNIIRFSKKEIEILLLISEGMNNKLMADTLYVSLRTIDSHKALLKQKLKLVSTLELHLFAVKNRARLKKVLDKLIKNNDCFSKRELEILLLISEGFKNRDIAERFMISPRTVSTHKSRLIK